MITYVTLNGLGQVVAVQQADVKQPPPAPRGLSYRVVPDEWFGRVFALARDPDDGRDKPAVRILDADGTLRVTHYVEDDDTLKQAR